MSLSETARKTYDELFGPPALDAVKDEEELDDFNTYAAVYGHAKERPFRAWKGVLDGISAHFRGAGPFNYETRCKEAAERAGGDGR